MTINEAITAALDEAKTELSVNTWRTYKNALEVFKQYLTDKKIDPAKTVVCDLSPDEFIRFPGSIVQMKYAKKTVKVYMAGVRYLFDWLTVQGEIEPNYNQSVRFTKAMRKAGSLKTDLFKRLPVRGHAEKMVEAVKRLPEESPRKERDIALVLFLATSGCRNSEAAQLIIKDIDLAERQAIIEHGKGDKMRNVFFSDEAAQAIREYWKARGFSGVNDPVFARHDKGAGKKAKPITTATVRNIVDDVSKLAGIEKGQFTPHYFRHAFAIKTLSETHDLALVQDLLGHSNPSITRLYAQIYPEDLRQAHRDIFK